MHTRIATLIGTLLVVSSSSAVAQARGAEERTARYLDAVRDQTPLLYAFLRDMPKGADLHSHLGGAVYAESFLRWAAEDGSCVSVGTLSIVNAPCTPSPDTIPAQQVVTDPRLYSALIDAFSMRNWHAGLPTTGHEQFFGSFGRTRALPHRTGDMLAEAVSRAASGNVAYLELMLTVDGGEAGALGRSVGWLDDFAVMRDTLLALGLERVVAQAGTRLNSIEARRDTVLSCGTAAADAGCAVGVRWIYQVTRAGAPEQVFAQILTGFLLTRSDPRVAGLNLVQPEDHPVAIRDYSLHMRMIEFLHRSYPGVPVSLHAGELAAGLVPPEALRFHIREAVEVAGARRIGHGVSIMYEDRPYDLLAELVRRGVMVEINLTSNDVILGVRGSDHPLRTYLAYGVPVALSTDDEGVARSEMSLEYLRAVRDHALDYPTLKLMARTSLQHAFLEGEPLWQDVARLVPVADCARAAGGLEGSRCRAFRERSARAALQLELEQSFTRFEAQYGSTRPASDGRPR